MGHNDFLLKDRLSDSQIWKFKLFEDEELIFATREHWLPLSIRILRVAFFSLILATFFSLLLLSLLGSMSIVISTFFLVVLTGNLIAVRELIHWSFHLYIATNRQIIEVQYTPLLSESINSVLLDQIRCTEIDVEMHGLIPELLGIGNVALTFDRPTHKAEFVIRDIRSPGKIANILSAQIHQFPTATQKIIRPLWTKELESNKYSFLGEANYGYSTN